jgi:23S rRNA pseudouridine1911/1915/1917 synthase
VILRAVVGPDQAGMRLDDGLSALFVRFSKTRIRNLIDWGGCRVRGAVVRVASRPLREGDEVVLAIAPRDPEVGYTLTPEKILFEDDEYLAIHKPEGVYCQRTPYQLKGTVEFAVGSYFRGAEVRESARLVHRLDRGTSGVMFFPKTRGAAAHLSRLLQAGAVEKTYWAVTAAVPDTDRWTADAPIASLGRSRFAAAPGGRPALTEFRLLARGDRAALVEARPRTGRTHQIRIHLSNGGFPVVGDVRYGGPPAARLMLHCVSMAFPAADGRPVGATAPPDEAFRTECTRLGISA